MSLEKVLQKIQLDIRDLTSTLELFFEDTIQPSVHDCEDLQKQLVILQENLAVYKYQKQNKEISPSFNIHAKVSEVDISREKDKTPVAEIKTAPVVEEKPVAQEPVKTVEPHEKPVAHRTTQKFSINLNDKFRFINELFAQNSAEYTIAMEQFINLKNWNDAEIYLNSLKSLYSWEEDKDIVKYFQSLIRKRFE